MKLPNPFYRLPLRFDVGRLQAEAAQFAETEWQRHPNGFAGNSAVRLITVGGEQNDAVAGAMLPTPQLQRSPYIRQVLAHFGVVFSRSRLMRLTPGAGVPEHSDSNYHWFHRVRIHIPIQTDPAVSFTCGGQTVHMGAGEAWIFDNWRLHSVHNGSARTRIHLVADTTGNAAFWGALSLAQSSGFDRRADLAALPYDPQADAQPYCERYNLATVMPPAEVEQLTSDLLVDLKRPQNEAESKACEHFAALASGFCREWRTLWSLYADTAEGWPRFTALRDFVRGEMSKVPPTVVCASNGLTVTDVFPLRVLLYAVRPPDSSGEAHARPDSDTDRTISAGAPAATSPRPLRRPLFIISAPRSGSTLLFETLAQARDLCSVGGEIHGLVEGLPQLRPEASGVGSNRLTEIHADAAARAHIHGGLAARLRDRDGNPPPEGPARLLEKTPKNALRIPFFNALFPDAQFIFLWRDPRQTLSSIMQAWRSGGWVTYKQLPGWDGPWSMLLPPGWERLRGASLEQVAAFQWARSNEIALDDLSGLPRQRWMALNYEDFLRDPAAAVRSICAFAEIDFDQRLAEHLARPLPLSVHTLTPPAPEKWRVNQAEIERVLPQLQPLIARLAALTPAGPGPRAS